MFWLLSFSVIPNPPLVDYSIYLRGSTLENTITYCGTFYVLSVFCGVLYSIQNVSQEILNTLLRYEYCFRYIILHYSCLLTSVFLSNVTTHDPPGGARDVLKR